MTGRTFGSDWLNVGDLGEGGQAHTFKVKRAAGDDETIFALKRLKNLKRIARFRTEVETLRAR